LDIIILQGETCQCDKMEQIGSFKRLRMRGDILKKILSYAYLLTGFGCLGYWLLIGVTARFGLDMHWIWLVVGGALTVAGLLCRWNGWPRWVRIGWRTAMCLGLALVIGLECCVISGMNAVPPEGLDYLIILGARVEPDGSPSKALKRRIDAAAKYLADNPETVAVATGGMGTDEVIPEAECIKIALVELGIEENRILVENQSTTTAENMEFSMRLMDGGAAAKVGVVSNNYHIFRALRLARKAGFENVYGLAADYTGYTLLHYMMREGACLVEDWRRGNL